MDNPGPGLLAMAAQARMWTDSALSLVRLSHAMPEGSQIRVESGFTTLCQKRNACALAALKGDLEWLLFMDSDIVATADAVPRLLAHPAGIVGGVYVERGGDLLPIPGRVAERPDHDHPLRPSDHPDFAYNPIDPRRCGDDLGALEVDVLGMGLTLIRRQVLEALDPPWFVENESMEQVAEDVNFCLRAKDAGFDIVCDTRVQAGHIRAKKSTVPESAFHLHRRQQAAEG